MWRSNSNVTLLWTDISPGYNSKLSHNFKDLEFLEYEHKSHAEERSVYDITKEIKVVEAFLNRVGFQVLLIT